jgi:hypothetical protein
MIPREPDAGVDQAEDPASARAYSLSEGYGSNGSKILERTDTDLNCISGEMFAVPSRLHPTVSAKSALSS